MPFARLVLALLILSAPSFSVQAVESAAPIKRVLIVHSFGRDFSPFNILAASFRRELALDFQGPIEFHEASIETVRVSEAPNEQPVVDYLNALFKKRNLDLIVAMGGPATLFMNRHRSQLFPEVPLIATLDERRVKDLEPSSNMTVVTTRLDLPGLVEDILRVCPATTNIVVALGATPLERYWAIQSREAFAGFTNRIQFSWLNDLSLEEMTRRVAALPPNSAVLYGTVALDAAGIPYEQDSALTALRAATAAPIFGVYKHLMGLGIVGGRLASNKDWGRLAAGVAIRILRGEAPAQVKIAPLGPEKPAYDWRELVHWNIDPLRLSPDSVVLFREPTLWEKHKWEIIGGIGFILFEAALIVGLLAELNRRRRAEKRLRLSEQDARNLSGRLIHAQEEERRRIARDLHDDLNQRLALLSVETDLLARNAGGDIAAEKLARLVGIIQELSTDVHKLAYQLHPAKLDQLGLVAAARGLCQELSQSLGLKIDFVHRDLPRDVPAEMALCAFRVLQESLHNVSRHSGAKGAQVELTMSDGSLRLWVKDDGKGFSVPEARRDGGLGLLSMQERSRLVRGALVVHSKPGQGTQVELTIPLPTE